MEGLSVGAAILTSVMMAEYVAVDPGAPLYALASAGLIALSYALFLLFVIALRMSGLRLFLSVPAIFLAAGLVALRTFHLRLSGRWEFPWALGIGLISAQLAAGLHYWPLTPLQAGLVKFVRKLPEKRLLRLVRLHRNVLVHATAAEDRSCTPTTPATAAGPGPGIHLQGPGAEK